ncbi:MAG: relaxase/mobilization nuclease domain-containing protein [Oscillospiraceae bacterium]|nr:relaxase/mobilization nuclease domain-containing protein [Oscillospiraceae bacterium]
MATTRIISMHRNSGKTVAQCLTDRTDYAKNPDKTKGGELIAAYACDPKTVDAEFLLSKRQYLMLTGRSQGSDVIAYQIRQSFRPGEVTPEEANKLGYELAERFLKGKHAFIVATHCDRAHPHNHIIFNSTSLDCKRKFHDFLGSGKAVARLSDTICLEHKLSIIEHPKLGSNSYNKWLGSKAKPSHRELLRTAIDGALEKKPADLNALLELVAEAGYEVKSSGANITFHCAGQKQNIRLRSLGEGYAEHELRAVLAGEKTHTPRKKRSVNTPQKDTLLIDIQAKLQAGKGGGYERWAKVYNVKQMAKTVNYLREHKLLYIDELTARTADATARFNTLSAQIKTAETRMAEIAVLKTHIINYSKTRDIYTAYRKAGYSKKYLAEHEGDIILHKAAKKAFDELGMKKLPTVKSLQEEYTHLISEKKAAYADYRTARDEMRELLIHKQNIDAILGRDEHKAEKEKEQERR